MLQRFSCISVSFKPPCFNIGSITIKANIELSEKESENTQDTFLNHYCLDS